MRPKTRCQKERPGGRDNESRNAVPLRWPLSGSEPAPAANHLGVYGGRGEAAVHTARLDHRLLRVDLGAGGNTHQGRPGLNARRAIHGELPAIDPGPSSPLADLPERITHPGLLHAPRLTSHLLCALWQGDWNLTAALLSLGVSEDKCEDAQKTYCDSMIDFNVQGGQSKNEARIATMKSYDQCRACLMTPADKKDFPPPFSLKSGKYHGNQFVSLGGGANAPPWTVEMASIGIEEIEKVKAAGFTGICFDIEAVDGRDELIAAFEETFARCRNAGVQVFITTSHSAPYESVPDKTRFDIVDAWAKSDNVDYFSPQLYTQGSESTPDFTEATGAGGVSVEWGRFKNMKAKFVPSIVSELGVEDCKTYFAGKGVHLDGFVLWGQVPDISGTSGDDMCVAHGICGSKAFQAFKAFEGKSK